MTDAELVQVYKNVKRNASVFSAIAQTHGNPSALYDYATKLAGELTAKMRARDIRAENIAPKPFDLADEQSEELVKALTLCRLLRSPARAPMRSLCLTSWCSTRPATTGGCSY